MNMQKASNLAQIAELEKQVEFHEKDSMIDDKSISLKLESELLEIQCEELVLYVCTYWLIQKCTYLCPQQNQLVLLEKRKEMNSAKQSQLKNAIKILFSDELSVSDMSTKEIARESLEELKRLQTVEREQKNAINLTEKEIRRIDGLIYDEQQRLKTTKHKTRGIKKKKKRKNKESFELQFDENDQNENAEYREKVQSLRSELEAAKKERMSMEEEWERNNEEIAEKERALESVSAEITECVQSKEEIQKIIHQYENSINTNKYKSERESRKNSEALEFIMEMRFRNKEYEMKMDGINDEYRKKQTFLREKFVADYNQKIKRNTKNRQMLIEQESDNIIQQRNDKEITLRTQSINESFKLQNEHQLQMQGMRLLQFEEASKFNNKTKPVKIRFGQNTIVSETAKQDEDEEANKINFMLKPIKFVWDDHDDREDTNHRDTDNEPRNENSIQLSFDEEVDADITTDLSLDDDDEDVVDGADGEDENGDDHEDEDYKNVLHEVMHLMDDQQIDIYEVLQQHMNVDDAEEMKLQMMANNSNLSHNDNDIQSQYLTFDSVNVVQELLMNWSFVPHSNSGQ